MIRRPSTRLYSRLYFRRALLAIPLLVGGCSHLLPDQNPTQPVTLKKALTDTVDALNAAAAQARRPGSHPWGFYACQLTASFVISATLGGSSNISVGGTVPGKDVTLAGGVGGQVSESAQHQSTVTLLLVSPLCQQPPHSAKGTPAANMMALPAPQPVFASPEPVMAKEPPGWRR